MAFWGIEVKPGKPVTHSFGKVGRRLRISQATLGIGSASKKSLVQCNVGNKCPVFLCALLPDKTESCHLDLEFEEADDVVFSVIGPRSVYLTGYYVSNSLHATINSDTESFGEDIANTETNESVRHTDEDEYENSFIDDDDPVVYPSSPVSSAEADEILDKQNRKEKEGAHKLLRKKYQVIDSDDDDDNDDNDGTSRESSDSGDSDNFLLSVFNNKKTTKSPISVGEKIDQGAVVTNHKSTDCGISGRVTNDKADDAVIMVREERESGPINSAKSKRKRKDQQDEVKDFGSSGNHGEDFKEDKELQAEAEAVGRGRHGCLEQDIDNKNPTINGQSSLQPLHDVDAECGQKSKKRRKEASVKETSFRSNNETHSNILVEDHVMQNVLEVGQKNKDLPSATGYDKKPTADRSSNLDLVAEISNSERSKKKKKKSKTQEKEADSNLNVCILSENDRYNSEKTKKKKKKSRTEKTSGDLNGSLSENENRKSSMESEERKFDAMSTQVRTLSNGLTIQELGSGGGDGKVAAVGRKVKVFYTAMLKEDGHVLDSNVGKTPLKFRLGDREIIEGWNVGLEGMRVGDRRRLVIPPSMGYGSQGAGENIPPDSWLIYDVDLVGVH